MSEKSHLGQENTLPITVNQHKQIASVEPRAAWPASLLRTCMTCCVLERRFNHRQENKSSKENARCSQSRVLAFPSCTEVDDQRSTAGEEQGCICGKSNVVLGLVPFSLIVICLSNSSSGEGEGRNKTNGYILFSQDWPLKDGIQIWGVISLLCYSTGYRRKQEFSSPPASQCYKLACLVSLMPCS